MTPGTALLFALLAPGPPMPEVGPSDSGQERPGQTGPSPRVAPAPERPGDRAAPDAADGTGRGPAQRLRVDLDVPAGADPGGYLRSGPNSVGSTGTLGGWRLGSAFEIGRESPTQMRRDLGSGTLPIFRGEWAWTAAASRTVGRSTFTLAGGVAHYQTPPPLLSRGAAGTAPFSRVIAPLSVGNPATIWEARARLDHHVLGERRQLRLFVEGLFSAPVGGLREIELPALSTPRPAATGRVFKGGAAVSF